MLTKGSEGSLRSGLYYALTVDDLPAAELSGTFRKIPSKFVTSIGLESREVMLRPTSHSHVQWCTQGEGCF